jgi:NADH dehydrogenase (ubiquinone) Fe-S protein 3
MPKILQKYKNKVQFFFLQKLKKIAPKLIQETKIKDCEISIKTTSNNLFALVDILKNKANIQFDQLIDIAVVDQPKEKFRFKIVYLFLSVKFNSRLSLITKTTEIKSVSSLISLFQSVG